MMLRRPKKLKAYLTSLTLCGLGMLFVYACTLVTPFGAQLTSIIDTPLLLTQTEAEAERKSHGCLSCNDGIETMHQSAGVRLCWSDCYCGNHDIALVSGVTAGSAEFESVKKK